MDVSEADDASGIGPLRTDGPDAEPGRIEATGARLRHPLGSLPAGEDLEIVVTAGSIGLVGGRPPTALQLPVTALRHLSCRRRRGHLELRGLLGDAGFHLVVAESSLRGGSALDLAELLGLSLPQGRAGRDRRGLGLVLMGLGMVLIGAGVALIASLGASSSPSASPSSPAVASRHRAVQQAASKNLVVGDVPAGWVRDDPSTSPLANLIGSTPSSTPTPAEKQAYRRVVDEFQRCMGVRDAKDRIFGKAGVQPLGQAPSAIYGIGGADGGIIEVGGVTQRYATDAQVAADLKQIKQPSFPGCFAATMGRLLVGSDPSSQPTAPTVEAVSQPALLGAYATRATAQVQLDDGAGGTVPVQLGVTVLVRAPYEATLYTFSTPGAFPAATADAITSRLAARLADLRPSVA